MNEVINLVPGGETAIRSALQMAWNEQHVQEFVQAAQQNFTKSPEFRSEIERAGFKVAELPSAPATKTAPDLRGLSEAEKTIVMNAIGGAGSSPDSPLVASDTSQKRQNGGVFSNITWTQAALVSLAVAAVVAIIVYRAVVFRALYKLATMLPLVGPVIKERYGEARQVISGKLSSQSRGAISAKVSELENLLRVKGRAGDGEPVLAKIIRLVQSLRPEDVCEVYDVAESVKHFAKNL